MKYQQINHTFNTNQLMLALTQTRYYGQYLNKNIITRFNLIIIVFDMTLDKTCGKELEKIR